MAYTEVAVQKPGADGWAELDLTDVPTQLGNCFDNDGKSVIIFTTGAEAVDLWIHTTAEAGTEPTTDIRYTQPATETHVLGPFPKDTFNHRSQMSELVNVSSNTGAAPGDTQTLTFGGQSTAALEWDDPVIDYIEGLEALTTIGDGNIRLICPCQTADGTAFVFEFCRDLGHTNVGAVTVANGGNLVSTITIVDGGSSTHQGQVLIDYDEATAGGPDVSNATIAVLSVA